MKVIYMMADTFRRDHLGAYGNDWIHTPSLDKLASESAVFDNAYIGSFPTGPNRRDTLLGRGGLGLPFNLWRRIENQEITIPERLAKENIPSMWIGDTQNNVRPCGSNFNKGYTAWYLNRGQEADRCWLDANVPLEWPVPPELIRYKAEVWHQVLINRAHRKVETDWFAPGTYSTAIKWLERNYKRSDFFLWIDTFDPHEPWDPPQHYLDMYDPGYTGRVFEAPTYGWIYTVWQGHREPSLIDLDADPLAEKNVLNEHPDAVKHLHAEIVNFMNSQGGISEKRIASFGAPKSQK